MTRSRRRLLIGSLLWLPAVLGMADVVSLGDARIDLLDTITVAYAKMNRLAPTEVAGMRERLEPLRGFVDPKDTPEAVYWLYFAVSNPEPRDALYHFELNKGFFWRANLYLAGAGDPGPTSSSFNLIHERFSINAVLPYVSLPVSVPADSTRHVYVEVRAYDVTQLRPYLTRDDVHARRVFVYTFVFGGLFGLFFGLLLYNGLLVFSLREPMYAFYLLFHLVAALYLLLVNGLVHTLFRGMDFLYLEFNLLPSLTGLVVLLALLFGRSFVGTKEFSVVFDRVLLVLSGCLFVAIVLLLLPVESLHAVVSSVGSVLLLGSLVFLVVTGVIGVVRHVHQSGLFLASWIVLVLGTAIALLHTYGIVTRWWPYLSMNGEQLGLVGCAVLLSLGIARRIKSVRDDRERLSVREIAARLRERRLTEVSRAKSDFLVTASHELRTPLANIRLPLEAIRAGDYGERISRSNGVFESMHRQTSRLLHRVENLLGHAQLEMGVTTVRPQPMEVDEYLRQHVADAQPAARREGLALKYAKLCDDDPRCSLDVRLFDSVLQNLLDNALKFTPAGGAVDFRLSAAADHVEIAVTDTGSGIPEDQLVSVLDRFSTASPEDDRTGAGVGLALVKEIVELHGGTLRMESEQGTGTTAAVVLPRFAETELVPAARPAVVGDARDSGVTAGDENVPVILVVDDDRDTVENLVHVLEKEHAVLTAQSGEEALRVLAEHAVSVIVSDLLMPGMSGLEFLRRVKKARKWRNLPFILLTAKASDEDEIESLQSGAVDYLRKPVSREVLLAKITSISRLHRGVREDYREGLLEYVARWDGRNPHRAESGFDMERLGSRYGLTQRQIDVLGLVVKGYTNKEISGFLRISPRTVDNHVSALLGKMGVERRTQLTFEMLEEDARFLS